MNLNVKMNEPENIMACLQALLNHSTLGSLVLEMWDLGSVWFAISIKVSLNRAIGSSDRVNSSDNHDTYTEGHQVSPVEFPVFKRGFIISKKSFLKHWEVIISTKIVMG